MVFIILGLSIFFVAIGLLVNEGNARYLLSGYNTMKEEDRKKVDIKSYIPYFRKFHIFLGVSFFVIGSALTYFINDNIGGIFLAIYPILCYLFFMVSMSKFSNSGKNGNRTGIIILLITLLFVIGLIAMGLRENRIHFNTDQIKLDGSYGETILKTEIKSIELINELPEIRIKTNGFAMGTIKKGYFKTKRGDKVKLILNTENSPYLLITKKNGMQVFYSSKSPSNHVIADSLKKIFPELFQ